MNSHLLAEEGQEWDEFFIVVASDTIPEAEGFTAETTDTRLGPWEKKKQQTFYFVNDYSCGMNPCCCLE